MYFNNTNNFFHGIMFHHFYDEGVHTRGQGSISKDDNGNNVIYVDYNDKTKKVICKLFKWKNLTQKRIFEK